MNSKEFLEFFEDAIGEKVPEGFYDVEEGYIDVKTMVITAFEIGMHYGQGGIIRREEELKENE